MIKTARQLKDLIRNLSRKKSADAQLLMRNYMMERFLERISLSEYRDKFILKGGMLVAAMVGLDARSTMDLDATVMSTEQTPVFFAAPKYPAMLSKLAKGRTESYGDSARGPTWQSHEQRFPAALQ